MLELKINNSIVQIKKDDLTSMDIEAIGFYAQNNLALGSGFGNAIAVRGGASIQEELIQFGTIPTCQVVITGAGDLKAKYIIHAVGPKFQERDIEQKLHKTMINALKAAEAKGLRDIAFPPMGAGFYGIPLPVCAQIMTDAFIEYLSQQTLIEKIVICVMDNKELKTFQNALENASIHKE